MYERTIDGEVLEFGHEGILYMNSFVMYDKGTESLWVHVTGQAVKGPRKGQQLKFFPSTITTWKAWKEQYPDTRVLTGGRARGFMGEFRGLEKRSFKNLGLAVFAGPHVRLYPYETMMKTGFLQDAIDDREVIVSFAAETGVARAWDPWFEGEALAFGAANETGEAVFVDVDTNSTWSGLSGICLEGAYEGEELQPLVSYAILIDRFEAFFPKGSIYGRPAKKAPADDDASDESADANGGH